MRCRRSSAKRDLVVADLVASAIACADLDRLVVAPAQHVQRHSERSHAEPRVAPERSSTSIARCPRPRRRAVARPPLQARQPAHCPRLRPAPAASQRQLLARRSAPAERRTVASIEPSSSAALRAQRRRARARLAVIQRLAMAPIAARAAPRRVRRSLRVAGAAAWCASRPRRRPRARERVQREPLQLPPPASPRPRDRRARELVLEAIVSPVTRRSRATVSSSAEGSGRATARPRGTTERARRCAAGSLSARAAVRSRRAPTAHTGDIELQHLVTKNGCRGGACSRRAATGPPRELLDGLRRAGELVRGEPRPRQRAQHRRDLRRSSISSLR